MATPSSIIPITDLPVSGVSDLDYLIATKADGSQAVRARVPELISAAQALDSAIDDVVAFAEQEAQTVLNSLGYLPPVPYASGVNVTNSRYTVQYAGDIYAPVSVPFTTGATFDSSKWRVVQGIASNELAQSSGSTLVGYSRSEAGSVPRNISDRLRDSIYVSDFGVTGSGDETVKIQYALDAAAGKTIFFQPGKVYSVSSAIQVSSGTTIIAYGATIRRIAAIDNIIRNKSAGTVGGYSASSDISIFGGYWDANTSSFPEVCTVVAFGHAQRIKMIDMRIADNTAYHHIEINGVNDCEIRGCNFTGGRSIAVTTNEAIQIDMNIDGSQFPWFGPQDSTPCRNVRITGNTFADTGVAIGSHTGATGIRHTGIVISNNEITGCYFASIAALNWADVKIINNRFTQGFYGIRALTAGTSPNNRQWVISGNTFYDMGNSPYSGTDARGIFFQAANDSGYGISSITITGNTFIDIVNAKALNAIAVNYCSNIAINGNSIRGVRASSVSIYGSNNVSISSNIISQSNSSAASDQAGISIAGPCTNVNLTSNTVDSVRIFETTRALVTANTINTSPISSGSNTQTSIVNNLVAGTYA